MKSVFVATALLLLPTFVHAQAPTLQWQRSLGGAAEDDGTSIAATSDGGLIVAGTTTSSDGDVQGHHGNLGIGDAWIVKLKPDHSIEWQRALGGTLDDAAGGIVQTSDGGFVVVGETGSSDGDFTTNNGIYDGFITKLDAQGNIVWSHTFGGQTYDYFYSVRETSDGGLIVCGSSNSSNGDLRGQTHYGGFDAWVLKLSSTGTLQWQKTYGGADDDEAYDIKQTNDGGYIFSGYTVSTNGVFAANHGGADIWVVKINSTGTMQWQKVFGGSLDEEGEAVVQTSDGGYAIAGYTTSFDGDVTDNHSVDTVEDCWLLKLNQAGAKQWAISYGGSDDDEANDLVESTADHGLVLAGFTSSFDGDVSRVIGPPDYWVVKTDASGLLQWQVSLGGGDSDLAYGITQTPTGYAVCGSSASVGVDVSGNHGGFDLWVADIGSTNAVSSNRTSSSGVIVFPNPFTLKTTLVLPDALSNASACTVILYNTLGVEVRREQTTTGQRQLHIDRGSLPAGVYRCRVSSSSGSQDVSVIIVD